ncbi:IS21-like element helper ATPase IstB [Herbaspirillum huttiense subsp. nephrolepidis]|uniref:IS21-like element helper ATPase IstB n=2 Tax=Herbaspirillum huttiense TaxID=863372 RepID=A0AAJ2H6P7_9BURK|nr:IS21-like element helper ATPase IstB [Herbaspirillum huttiense]
MNNLTIDKMHQLKLAGMAAEFERQISTPGAGEAPFEQRVRSLVDHEITVRDNRRQQLLLKRAALPVQAALEDVNYTARRNLDKSMFSSLASLDWISQRHNLIITGPTGTGKSWLACALANQACRDGLTAHFIRVPILIESFVTSRAMGSFVNRIQQLKKFDLLILDDWGIDSFNKRAQSDMLELMESRMGSRSTLFTSQLPLEDWHKTFDNKTVADAFMDRVVNSSHEIKLKGESLRAAQGLRSKTSSRKTPASS